MQYAKRIAVSHTLTYRLDAKYFLFKKNIINSRRQYGSSLVTNWKRKTQVIFMNKFRMKYQFDRVCGRGAPYLYSSRSCVFIAQQKLNVETIGRCTRPFNKINGRLFYLTRMKNKPKFLSMFPYMRYNDPILFHLAVEERRGIYLKEINPFSFDGFWTWITNQRFNSSRTRVKIYKFLWLFTQAAEARLMKRFYCEQAKFVAKIQFILGL